MNVLLFNSILKFSSSLCSIQQHHSPPTTIFSITQTASNSEYYSVLTMMRSISTKDIVKCVWVLSVVFMFVWLNFFLVFCVLFCFIFCFMQNKYAYKHYPLSKSNQHPSVKQVHNHDIENIHSYIYFNKKYMCFEMNKKNCSVCIQYHKFQICFVNRTIHTWEQI